MEIQIHATVWRFKFKHNVIHQPLKRDWHLECDYFTVAIHFASLSWCQIIFELFE